MKRELTNNERKLLIQLVNSAQPEMADNLKAQIDNTIVLGGKPTMLELEVDPSAAPYTKNIEPQPLPIKAIAKNDQGESVGELLLWTTDGYLSHLEYAWFTDEIPTELPSQSQVQIISE